MAKNVQPPPVPVLELAPLPREQVGPFLLLGVDKTADKSQIEAAWAQRVIWARKKHIKTPLEDINWAREIINDKDRRLKADAAALNLDTTDQVLCRLRERFGGSLAPARPMDVELALDDYTPPMAIPDAEEVRAGIPQPQPPRELPVVRRMVAELAAEPLDPWSIQ